MDVLHCTCDTDWFNDSLNFQEAHKLFLIAALHHLKLRQQRLHIPVIRLRFLQRCHERRRHNLLRVLRHVLPPGGVSLFEQCPHLSAVSGAL